MALEYYRDCIRNEYQATQDNEAAVAREAVKHMLYEIAKELDISSQDIRDSNMTIDEMAAVFADRVRESFAEDPPLPRVVGEQL